MSLDVHASSYVFGLLCTAVMRRTFDTIKKIVHNTYMY